MTIPYNRYAETLFQWLKVITHDDKHNRKIIFAELEFMFGSHKSFKNDVSRFQHSFELFEPIEIPSGDIAPSSPNISGTQQLAQILVSQALQSEKGLEITEKLIGCFDGESKRFFDECIITSTYDELDDDLKLSLIRAADPKKYKIIQEDRDSAIKADGARETKNDFFRICKYVGAFLIILCIISLVLASFLGISYITLMLAFPFALLANFCAIVFQYWVFKTK